MNRDLVVRATYFALRVIAGLVIAEMGCTIVFGWFGGTPGGMPPLVSELDFGAMIEVVAGLMIVLGLLTRPVAFVLAGEMAVAYWQYHSPTSIWPSRNGGVPAILFCFIYLYMAGLGGGEWSLDALIAAKRKVKRRT